MFTELGGEPVRQAIEKEITESVKEFKGKGVYPKLAILRAGEDAGQVFYENAILKAADDLGILTQTIAFSDSTTQAYMEVAVQAFNADDEIHGIILLRPFPEHIDEERIRRLLNPSKDVDAVTDISIARTITGKSDLFHACTAESCMEMLRYYDIDPAGKKVTIVGRSLTVGKPLAMLMMNSDATVTVCHKQTSHEDVVAACKSADIIVLATGKTEGYGAEYFRDGQIILDVGAGTGRDGKLHGDLDIEDIKASGTITDMTYTPVPGGIGMVTTVLLLRNIIKAAARL